MTFLFKFGLTWNAEGSDEHGDASEKEDCPRDWEEPSEEDESVLVEEDHQDPEA